MSKHTEGPWIVLLMTGEQGALWAIQSPTIRIADVRHFYDARLIAAAPDLLTALQEVVRVVEAPASTVSMPQTMRVVKAAIKAATEGR